jgi:hypothetical protein
MGIVFIEPILRPQALAAPAIMGGWMRWDPIWTRLVWVAAALAAVYAAVVLLWPVTARSVARPVSKLDGFAPVWEFGEFHQIRIAATPERIWAGVLALPAEDIWMFRTLTWLRRFGRPGPESILNAPEKQPILEVALKSGFRKLAQTPDELVIATRVAAGAMAYMNFRIASSNGSGCLLTTETRVHGETDSARRAFGVYWRLIYPGSSLIRYSWLAAIKRRAESTLAAAPVRAAPE